ncbi:hypothetical protein BL253_21910 [Pseudofrankia asymbiotica]|uniref:Uncharacterized protein n=1 Tax=Pseudofrankia asymbiotica TaxID=1834516 RepID=A0A1V2I775_9ACTN|nr:hypothetical protein [Pseudofrankia asymbiotica]ONH27546.1 hypothetical protein BL253_21910 [Pseudofrankia asymbiotica]
MVQVDPGGAQVRDVQQEVDAGPVDQLGRKDTGDSSSPVQPNRGATFSTASGTGRASRAMRAFSTVTASEVRVNGTGRRCPLFSSPDRRNRVRFIALIGDELPALTALGTRPAPPEQLDAVITAGVDTFLRAFALWPAASGALDTRVSSANVGEAGS